MRYLGTDDAIDLETEHRSSTPGAAGAAGETPALVVPSALGLSSASRRPSPQLGAAALSPVGRLTGLVRRATAGAPLRRSSHVRGASVAQQRPQRRLDPLLQARPDADLGERRAGRSARLGRE